MYLSADIFQPGIQLICSRSSIQLLFSFEDMFYYCQLANYHQFCVGAEWVLPGPSFLGLSMGLATFSLSPTAGHDAARRIQMTKTIDPMILSIGSSLPADPIKRGSQASSMPPTGQDLGTLPSLPMPLPDELLGGAGQAQCKPISFRMH